MAPSNSQTYYLLPMHSPTHFFLSNMLVTWFLWSFYILIKSYYTPCLWNSGYPSLLVSFFLALFSFYVVSLLRKISIASWYLTRRNIFSTSVLFASHISCHARYFNLELDRLSTFRIVNLMLFMVVNFNPIPHTIIFQTNYLSERELTFTTEWKKKNFSIY